MVSEFITIKNETGLHARPATTLINMVKNYKCTVYIYSEDIKANAGSIINLLTLGAKKGTKLKVECNGEDEKEALEQVCDFLKTMKD